LKFTEKGGVTLTISEASNGWNVDQEILNQAETVVSFTVEDTGIGIAPEKHQIIFEAFQQADGTTSRKYGGTGLGLSISREIARVLGGEIRLRSALGKGSTFTLFLPATYVSTRKKPAGGANGGPERFSPSPGQPEMMLASSGASYASAEGMELVSTEPVRPSDEVHVDDDRATIHAGDRVLLIVEDDPPFAKILLNMARERGFKGLVATRTERALAAIRDFKIDAVTLDLRLPDGDGWTVLDRLKHNPKTRHIPVHIISVESERQRGLKLGALAYLEKPASKETLDEAFARIKDFIERPVKNLLLVEDNQVQRQSIVDLIGNSDVHTTAVASGLEALTALRESHFDCMVLDLGLPDMTGFQLLERIKEDADLRELPIIIYTGKELSKKEETDLRGVAEAIVIKDVKSPERLFDETALFLHRIEANLPEPKRRVLAEVHRSDATLTGRTVLVVDDDIRNIFALTNVLERHGIHALHAESGKEGIALLTSRTDIEAVLMDVMMPEMDGYETMRAIRKMGLKKLPIVALTAKAMKGDREKCVEAGASDYITKPVDVDQLLSVLRVWLYR
jgi:CheY-like chemotaxis protein